MSEAREERLRVVYVAGPYRAATVRGIVENIRTAEFWALEIWRWGGVALCPHLNTRLFDGAAPDEVWLKGDLELLRRCDAVALVPGWQASAGTRGEVAFAEELKLPVFQMGSAAQQLALQGFLIHEPELRGPARGGDLPERKGAARG
jgi:hypothetical protein